MTAEEISRKYHISMDKIRYYEENGLLEHSVLPDRKIEYIEAQIRILRKQRFLLLDEIHEKQQALDKLDYMIGELKKEGAAG